MGIKALPLAHLPSAPSYGLWGGGGSYSPVEGATTRYLLRTHA